MNKGKKIIHIVPNFHYDVEYLRTYEEYRDLCLDNIVKAIRLLLNNPDYRFMIEQVVLLQEFWERYPHFREELKGLIKQGRFEIACGMYCMPDTNIPSGEFFIEQAVWGKKWIKDTFDVDIKVCWIADCFGQHPQLPQIVKKCGYEYYFFSRGAVENQEGDFLWRGLDKTVILTHRGPKAYTTLILRAGKITNAADLIIAEAGGQQAVLDAIMPVEDCSSTPNILCNNGGDFLPPQEGMIPIVRRWRHEDYECIFSTPLRYFESIKDNTDRMTVYEDDFNPVNQGCYSSRIKIKQNNRALENMLCVAERMKFLYDLREINAGTHGKLSLNPDSMLHEAKRLTLFNQFHDTICGTIVDQAYLDCMQRYKNAVRLVKSGISSIFDELAGEGNEGDKHLYVFNPSSHIRKEAVEITLDITDDKKMGIRLFDSSGKEVLAQEYTDIKNKRNMLVFAPEVQGMSMNAYRLEFKESGQPAEINLSKLDKAFEFANMFYTARIEANGIISSLRTPADEELVDIDRPWFNDILMQSDYGDLWVYTESPHNGGYFGRPVKKAPYLMENTGFLNECYGHSKNSNRQAELVENGPVRVVIKAEGTVKFWRIECKYTQYIYLYRHSPRIDFKTEVQCHGRNYRLRVCFPTSIKRGKIEHEIPFGMCERREEEYAAMNWISYRDKQKGLLLLNKGLPGNNVDDGVMMLSLMRSTTMDYKAESDLAYEEGENLVFEYSVLPFDGELKEIHPWRHGENLNMQFVSRIYNTNSVNISNGFISLDKDNIVLSRVFRHEESVAVRFYEACGEETDCSVTLKGSNYDSYIEADCLLNRTGSEQKLDDNSFILKFKPFEIKTILMTGDLKE